MAHKKAGGTASNLRDSKGQRLGIKKYGDEIVRPGNIIVRQHGNTFHPGDGVNEGHDHTIFAIRDGKVKFSSKKVRGFHGNLQNRRFVSVVEK